MAPQHSPTPAASSPRPRTGIPPECPIKPAPGQRRLQDLQDTVTDTYKLALAVLRCLTPGKGASTASSPGPLGRELDPQGASLVARALSTDRAVPADSQGAVRLLSQRRRTPYRSPRDHPGNTDDTRPAARPGRPGRMADPRGSPRHYLCREELHRPGGPGRASSRLRLPADASGPVRLEVGNRFGSVTMNLGESRCTSCPRSPSPATICPGRSFRRWRPSPSSLSPPCSRAARMRGP